MARDGDLRILFRNNLPQVFWTSVETGATGRGTPDSFGCYKGKSFWLEFKKTDHWNYELSAHQKAWHLRLARAGGNSWIIVRRARTELWMIPGKHADIACPLDHEMQCFFSLHEGGIAKWDWISILQTILSGK